METPWCRGVDSVSTLSWTFGDAERFRSSYVLKKLSTYCGRRSGPSIALFSGMDYDKLKALMEASREESAVQRNPMVIEFPKPDSRPDWKYLDYVAKQRRAA